MENSYILTSAFLYSTENAGITVEYMEIQSLFGILIVKLPPFSFHSLQTSNRCHSLQYNGAKISDTEVEIEATTYVSGLWELMYIQMDLLP